MEFVTQSKRTAKDLPGRRRRGFSVRFIEKRWGSWLKLCETRLKTARFQSSLPLTNASIQYTSRMQVDCIQVSYFVTNFLARLSKGVRLCFQLTCGVTTETLYTVLRSSSCWRVVNFRFPSVRSKLLKPCCQRY